MDDRPRLIERAFCLRQASINSVHEKSVRHGHISTLHIWPARRPLAASRAALIATLLPDPESPEERRAILERLGGKVVTKRKGKSGKIAEVTEGGILHWGRESEPDIDWFREEIRKAYGGRAPKVLDPFAGGGSIPFEAMRLGCKATAIDINPVAWFILKCTLDYPNRVGREKLPLPRFALESPEFMEGFYKRLGKKIKEEKGTKVVQSQLSTAMKVDLSWHVRAWGWWVLQQTRRELEEYYPVVDGKLTVAYLWARTVKCKNCRATIPLFKTRWLCKKDNKRVLLTMKPNEKKDGVIFGIQNEVTVVGDTPSVRRSYDRQLGQGTLSRTGAYCPCCGKPGTVAMEIETIRQEGIKGNIGNMPIAVVYNDKDGKKYRLFTDNEIFDINLIIEKIEKTYLSIPFGIPTEPLPSKEALGIRVPLYGYDQWFKLFNQRQLLALGTFVKYTRASRDAMRSQGYKQEWIEGVNAYLALAVDRLADYSSTLCMWINSRETLAHTFTRFALPIVWDFCEVNPLSESTGNYAGAVDWIARVVQHCIRAIREAPLPVLYQASAIELVNDPQWDAVITDPPYYNAIPYSDTMDFFYIWLRRCIGDLNQETTAIFAESLGPKWNKDKADGELIDDASRHEGDAVKSKAIYEEGMYRAFHASFQSLKPDGRFVVVFANKQPDAWETLVSSIVRAGFVVTASWPIQTERSARMRAFESAALSSSVWLVCKKRSKAAQPGWDNVVLEEMKNNIFTCLHEYWDAGIRGPDFVWAATGPALEAYSKYPVVKKANNPSEIMTITEFLRQVRRLVVDFVVGRVLSRNSEKGSFTGLDDITTYYLLHRHDFGLKNTPIGPCILYAVSCGLSDTALTSDYDLLQKTGGENYGEGEDTGEKEGKGSTVRLKPWNKRKARNLGEDVKGHPAPIIDRIHHLMQLWRSGDPIKVDEYLEIHSLTRSAAFHQVLQAIIELAKPGEEERSILEAISNHMNNKGGTIKKPKTLIEYYNKTK